MLLGIAEFSKVAGYKVTIQKSKSIEFLYTSNEQLKIQIKNTIYDSF